MRHSVTCQSRVVPLSSLLTSIARVSQVFPSYGKRVLSTPISQTINAQLILSSGFGNAWEERSQPDPHSFGWLIEAQSIIDNGLQVDGVRIMLCTLFLPVAGPD